MHVGLEVNHIMRWGPEPCPTSSHPLHHLVHSRWREGGARDEAGLVNAGSHTEAFAFECSSNTCSVTLLVRFRPPLLSYEHIQILTDKAHLNRRTEEVINSDPARFEGHRKPTPVDVLSDLRSYLKNSFEHQESRPIKADNKRFPLRFGIDGQACKDVLTYLGFKYDVCIVSFTGMMLANFEFL